MKNVQIASEVEFEEVETQIDYLNYIYNKIIKNNYFEIEFENSNPEFSIIKNELELINKKFIKIYKDLIETEFYVKSQL